MADGTVLQFKADLKAFSDAVGVTVGAATQKITILIHDDLVNQTPRLTGRAAGSWGISLDTPGDYELPPGEYGGSGRAAQSQQRVLRELQKSPFRTVWIFNNISYLEALNMGHSRQAAAGFIELVLAQAEAAVDGILEESSRGNLPNG
jgi:hypothetical protein